MQHGVEWEQQYWSRWAKWELLSPSRASLQNPVLLKLALTMCTIRYKLSHINFIEMSQSSECTSQYYLQYWQEGENNIKVSLGEWHFQDDISFSKIVTLWATSFICVHGRGSPWTIPISIMATSVTIKQFKQTLNSLNVHKLTAGIYRTLGQ